jgi:hypothetical protein
MPAKFFILHFAWPHVRSVPGYIRNCCCLVLNNTCLWSIIAHRADVKEWRWRRALSWWRTSYRKAVTSLGDGACDAIEDSKVNMLSDAMGRELMTLNFAAVSAMYCSVQVVPHYLHCTAVPELCCVIRIVRCLICTAVCTLYYIAYVVIQYLSFTAVSTPSCRAWVLLQNSCCTAVPTLYCSVYIVLQCLHYTAVSTLYCSPRVVLQCLHCTAALELYCSVYIVLQS